MKIVNKLFSWFKHDFMCPDVRALNATIFVHATPKPLLVGNIVYDDHNWVFLPDLNTSSYIPSLERWILPFPYIQRQTVLIVRNIMCEDCKWVI